MSTFDPPVQVVRDAAARALAEDLGPLGDVTAALVAPGARAVADIVVRRRGVLAGTACATEVFAQLDDAVGVAWLADDGAELAPSSESRPHRRTVAIRAHRRAHRAQLSVPPLGCRHAHRARSCAPAGDTTRIWDTRKTIPGLRALEKAAVRAGGGVNHRATLSDFVLVKDNHLGDLAHRAKPSSARAHAGRAAWSKSSASGWSRCARRSPPVPAW